MKKRRLVLITSLPLTVAIILGVLAMLPPRPESPRRTLTESAME